MTITMQREGGEPVRCMPRTVKSLDGLLVWIYNQHFKQGESKRFLVSKTQQDDGSYSCRFGIRVPKSSWHGESKWVTAEDEPVIVTVA